MKRIIMITGTTTGHYRFPIHIHGYGLSRLYIKGYPIIIEHNRTHYRIVDLKFTFKPSIRLQSYHHRIIFSCQIIRNINQTIGKAQFLIIAGNVSLQANTITTKYRTLILFNLHRLHISRIPRIKSGRFFIFPYPAQTILLRSQFQFHFITPVIFQSQQHTFAFLTDRFVLIETIVHDSKRIVYAKSPFIIVIHSHPVAGDFIEE